MRGKSTIEATLREMGGHIWTELMAYVGGIERRLSLPAGRLRKVGCRRESELGVLT